MFEVVPKLRYQAEISKFCPIVDSAKGYICRGCKYIF